MKKKQKNKQHDPYNTIMIKGEGFHATIDGELYLDSDGKRVPKYICLCHAYEASECICGAWDYGLPDSYYL